MFNYIKSIKSKNGYRFFLKLGFFILIFFLVDLSIGKVFYSFYSQQKSGWEYRTKYSIEDTKADMLMFGSSRAQQQYNPTFFEERLNLSCYNTGRDGEDILYQYAVFIAVLKRYKPKVILLECENKMFYNSKDSYDRLSCFLPFYKDHPEIRSIIELRSPNERVKLLSHMYPYNSLFFKISNGNISKDEDIKGYLPLKGALNEPMRPVNYSNVYDLDSIKIKFYNSIIDLCKKSDIHLVLVCSPYFSKGFGNDTSLILAKKIAKENNIPFFDLSRGHPLLDKSNLFDDTAHVNQTGSKILSNIIIDSIKQNAIFK
ncbi:MAG TPA: hypothetical protein VN958_09365 [Chitinophagaceae bacterium]|nr:hypothetical protein [Chitinophagaceae bacterium]